jgi:hypothetical protein
VTIENDDGQAFFQVTDVTIGEGPNAKAIATVTLTKGVEGDASFSWTTVNGTALGGTDFTSISQAGKIEKGQTSALLEVSIVDDELDEKDEKFTIQLSGGTGGATTSGGGDPTAEVTITDNDDAPTLKFDSTDLVSIVEGDSGTKIATYKIKLSEISGREVSVRVRTVDGSAVGGQDYVTFDQVVKIAAGQTEATFSVVINGDVADEIDESFSVQLSELDGATLEGSDEVETKVLNNDRQIVIDDVTVSEAAGQATFTLRLNAPSLHPITVKFKTSDGTAIGGDGTGAGRRLRKLGRDSGYLCTGQVSQTVSVNIVGDTSAEAAETFFGELLDPANAVIATQKATATNHERRQRIPDFRRASYRRGPGSTKMMVFTVTRQGSLSGPSPSTLPPRTALRCWTPTTRERSAR